MGWIVLELASRFICISLYHSLLYARGSFLLQ
jgi:hypothetical protein